MLIECLIEKGAGSQITPIHIGGFDYLFRPNEHGHSVCEVNSGEAKNRLLSLKHFREYEPPMEYMTKVPVFRAVTGPVSKRYKKYAKCTANH